MSLSVFLLAHYETLHVFIQSPKTWTLRLASWSILKVTQ